MMTENMKIWLKKLYLNEANDHLETARFEHLCALGAPTDEASTLHEMNADEHRAFAMILETMANKIEEEPTNEN
jgi:hypothetical protein